MHKGKFYTCNYYLQVYVGVKKEINDFLFHNLKFSADLNKYIFFKIIKNFNRNQQAVLKVQNNICLKSCNLIIYFSNKLYQLQVYPLQVYFAYF